ncbi:MAG: hypothetical protein RIQ81_667 [Pseudomonadota bacterium]
MTSFTHRGDCLVLVRTTLALVAISGLVGCSISPGTSFLRSVGDNSDQPAEIPPSLDDITPEMEANGYQSYAFYEGLSAEEMRSGSRTDGTSSDMPCISKAEIARAQDTSHIFWHGHDNEKHTFRLTSEHYSDLGSGKPVQIYTTVVDGHRHAVLIDPRKSCRVPPNQQRRAEGSTQTGRSHFLCKQLGNNAWRPYYMKWDGSAGTYIDFSTKPKGLLGASAMKSEAECQRSLENANHEHGVICSATGIGWKPTLYTGTLPGRADYGYLGGSSMEKFDSCLLAVRNSSAKGVCYWGGNGSYYISPIDRADTIGHGFSHLEECVQQTR